MIRCKILVTGPYSDYQGSGTNRKAVVHTKGQIIQFPASYAILLEKGDMIEILPELELGESDVIEIDEIDQELLPPDATESAVEFAADSKVDLTLITGTGVDGRITLADVRRHQVESGA